MRVALVTNFSPRYRRELFLELNRRVELTLILTSRGNEWYWEGDRPRETAGISTLVITRPLGLARQLQRGGYDAVISDLTGRATLLTTAATCRLRRIPFILWAGIWDHPRTFAHRLSRPLMRTLYRSADAVVTYGTHVSDFVASESGRTEAVFVAVQAVENDRFRAPVPEGEVELLRERLNLDGKPTFVFVGRLIQEKGLDYLVDACARVTVPHQVVIAGRGPLLDSIRDRAAALGIADRLCFAGYVDQPDLPTLLQASDVLLLPSVSTDRFREPWGLVANEAMNCGLPVIATTSVGAAAGGLIVDGETGIVIPERDATALAQAIEDLATDETRRRRLGEQASARVLAWNYVAAADAFVEALASASRRGRST